MLHVKNLKQQNEKLLRRCQENEQYSRRLCVRITGIPSQIYESAEDVKKFSEIYYSGIWMLYTGHWTTRTELVKMILQEKM